MNISAVKKAVPKIECSPSDTRIKNYLNLATSDLRLQVTSDTYFVKYDPTITNFDL